MNNQDFADMDVRDLIFQIWMYNEDRLHTDFCLKCQALHKSARHKLNQKWQPEWGDLDYFIRHLLFNPKFYVNVRNYVIYGESDPTNFMKQILKDMK